MSGAGDGGSARDLVVDIHKQGLQLLAVPAELIEYVGDVCPIPVLLGQPEGG